jgi:hypothetical protein
MLSDVDMGDTVYEIRAGDQRWLGVGHPVKHTPRAGFATGNRPTGWLSATVHVTDAYPSDIPTEGLSLYEGEDRIGEDRGWHLVACTPAGGLRIVQLSTTH